MRYEKGVTTFLFSNSLELLLQEIIEKLIREYSPTTRYLIVTPNARIAAWARMKLTQVLAQGTLGVEFLTAPDCFEKLFQVTLSPLPLVEYLTATHDDREIERSYIEIVGVTQAGYRGRWTMDELNPFSFQSQVLSRELQVPSIASEVIFFGWSSLTEAYVKAIKIVGSKLPTIAALFSPCMLFWSDILSHREEKALFKRLALLKRLDRIRVSDPVINSLEVLLACKEPFLANAGVLARTFSRILDEEGIEGQELYILPKQVFSEEPYHEVVRYEAVAVETDTSWTLLDRIKTDMLLLISPEKEAQLAVSLDKSIQIHTAYTPLQEVEALRDALYSITIHETLGPGDVVVVVSDPKMYLEPLRQVFDEAPYQMMGMLSPEVDQLFQLFSYLFLLSEQRLSKEEIGRLVAYPSFSQALGIDAYECRSFLDASQFLWGLNVEHQQKILQYEGFAAASKTGSLKDVVEAASIFDEQAKMALRLYTGLNSCYIPSDIPQSLSKWIEHAQCILSTCFQEEQHVAHVRAALKKCILDESCSQPAQSLSAHLALFLIRQEVEVLAQSKVQPLWAPLLVIPFQGPVPPAKYVLMVGLDAVYKNDQIAREALESYSAPYFQPNYLIGQTMIEALFAAKKACLLSYKCYSFERREMIKPPTILRELLEALDGKYRVEEIPLSEAITYHHEMKRYASSYEKVVMGHGQCMKRVEEVPSCAALMQFARHPLRRYLKQQCGVDFGANWERKLASEWIPGFSVRRSVRAQVESQLPENIGKSGLLGELYVREVQEQHAHFQRNLSSLGIELSSMYSLQFHESIPARCYEKEIMRIPQPKKRDGNGLITGSMQGVYEEGLIFYSHDMERELIQRYPEIVLRAVAGLTTTVISPLNQQTKVIEIVNPRELLERWYTFFQDGAFVPYPFYPEVISLLKQGELSTSSSLMDALLSELDRLQVSLPISVEQQLYKKLPSIEVLQEAISTLYLYDHISSS